MPIHQVLLLARPQNEAFYRDPDPGLPVCAQSVDLSRVQVGPDPDGQTLVTFDRDEYVGDVEVLSSYSVETIARGLHAWSAHVQENGPQAPCTLSALIRAGLRFEAGATPAQEYTALMQLVEALPNPYEDTPGASLTQRVRRVIEGLVGGQRQLQGELALLRVPNDPPAPDVVQDS